ncbi:MAG: hypothetical protein ACTSXD_10075, partial [Candidatus Heimdallarchaeaceae archaeon]
FMFFTDKQQRMEKRKLRARRLNKILLITLLLITTFSVSIFGRAYFSSVSDFGKTDPNYSTNNIVAFDTNEPIIDGNLETYEGEWANATVYSNIIDGINYTITLKANETHLFFGISYETNLFVELTESNASIPHTWYTIVFDSNFDKEFGTELVPEDTILFNYQEKNATDATLNGTETNSLILDEDLGGEDNTVGAMQTDLFVEEYTVTIEIAKELNSGDKKGNDISLQPSDAILFALIPFANHTNIFNNIEVPTLQWNSLRLEPTQEFYSYVKNTEDLSVVTYITDSVRSNKKDFNSIGHMLEAYQLNSQLADKNNFEITTENLNDVDLFIMAGNQKSLTSSQIAVLRSYLTSGGSILLIADEVKNESSINEFLRMFNMEFYNATLYSNNTAINDSLTFDQTALAQLDYLQEDSVFTETTFDNVFYTGTAIKNISTYGENILFGQDADLYPILSKEGEFFINLGEKTTYNSSEDISINNAILQTALELKYGGKMIVSASSDMYNSTNLVFGSNKMLLLKEIQWLLNFRFRINYENFNIPQSKVTEGNPIEMNISVTGDNDTVLADVEVQGRVLVLKSVVSSVTLNVSDNNIDFYGQIVPKTKASWVDVEILMHKRGYGYNYTELVEILIEKQIEIPIAIDYVSLIIFIASIGLAIIGIITLKRHKIRKEE